MKYATIIPGKTIPTNIKNCLEEQPARSGFYNWLFVFKGEIRTWESIKDNLEDYDVLQVNMSPADMPLIPEIRRKIKSSSTMLVLNNDYVCEFWGKWGIDPWRYLQAQRMGDMVFGTEPHQVSNMIKGAYCIPHPTNTKMVKRLGVDASKKTNSAGFMFHWWAGMSYLAYQTLSQAKEKHNLDKLKIFGYKPDMDEMAKYKGIMWDEICELEDFPSFADEIQRMKFVYDPNPYHTYGRNGVECACWKIPVVGSNRVYSYNMLFPELTCEPFNNVDIHNQISKVMSSKEMEGILENAYETVEYFNYENSKTRYLTALEECKSRGGVAYYGKQ